MKGGQGVTAGRCCSGILGDTGVTNPYMVFMLHAHQQEMDSRPLRLTYGRAGVGLPSGGNFVRDFRTRPEHGHNFALRQISGLRRTQAEIHTQAYSGAIPHSGGDPDLGVLAGM